MIKKQNLALGIDAHTVHQNHRCLSASPDESNQAKETLTERGMEGEWRRGQRSRQPMDGEAAGERHPGWRGGFHALPFTIAATDLQVQEASYKA